MTEYRSLPIECKWFELVHKRLFDFVQEILDKISRLTKTHQSKTRLAIQQRDVDRSEKMLLTAAKILYEKIDKLAVFSEDFEYFNEQYRAALTIYERAKMFQEEISQKPTHLF